MREKAKPAVEAWLATRPFQNSDAPPNPFVMKEHVLAKSAEPNEKAAEAVTFSQEALAANRTSENYVLITVILVTALFFAGIASRLSFRMGFIIMLVAMAALGFGIYNIASYPVLFLCN